MGDNCRYAIYCNECSLLLLLSPVIMIDGRTYGKLTAAAIPAILKQYETEDTL